MPEQITPSTFSKTKTIVMEENQSILELQVDQTASKNLSDAARWAKFLCIVGFVGIALMVICVIALQSRIVEALSEIIPGLGTDSGLALVITTFIIVAVIVGILIYFLFRASILIKRGIQTRNQEVFNSGLASLKAYFTMYGVLAILQIISAITSLNR